MALTCPDEPSLRRLAMKLRAAGVELTMIIEPDEPWHGALMALGLAPRRKEELRRHLSSLPLLR